MNMNDLSKWDRFEYELSDIVQKTKDLVKLADELHQDMLSGRPFMPLHIPMLKKFADDVIEATDGNDDVVYAFNHALKERGVC